VAPYAKAINSSYLENQYQAQALDMPTSCIMQIKWAAKKEKKLLKRFSEIGTFKEKLTPTDGRTSRY
jgi:hypothetical protein